MCLMRRRNVLGRQNENNQKQLSRRSFISASLVTTLAATNSSIAWHLHRSSAVDQPDRFTVDPQEYSLARELPKPDEPVEDIMRQLLTPEEYAEFVEKNVTFEEPSFPVEFMSTYRRSPEEFQEDDWTGCCNDLTEFACEWSYRHNYTPYVVSICPHLPETVYKSWHQFAVVRVESGLLIFDNKTLTTWNGTIQQYIAKEHPGKCMLPGAGCTEWKKTQDNWNGRMMAQLQPNTHDLVVSQEPQIPAHPSSSPEPPVPADIVSNNHLPPDTVKTFDWLARQREQFASLMNFVKP